MSEDLTLIIDQREDPKLRKMIRNSPLFADIPMIFRNLNIGDYVFARGDQPVFLIERKSVADLASSIKSKKNRYREQKHRICHDSGLPRDRLMYLIEGYHKVSGYSTICGLPKSTIVGSFVNTIARDKLHVYHTQGHQETCEFLAKLYFSLVKFGGDTPKQDYVSVDKMATKKDKMTPGVVYLHQLTMFPGVSPAVAQVIAEKYPSFPELLKAWGQIENPGKVLANLKINGKRFGDVRSQRVVEYFMQTRRDNNH